MHTLDDRCTALADAAALMELGDRIEHTIGWLVMMLNFQYQIPSDPIAEAMQAEAVFMGIQTELAGLGLARASVPSLRDDPLGFMRQALACLQIASLHVRSVPS